MGQSLSTPLGSPYPVGGVDGRGGWRWGVGGGVGERTVAGMKNEIKKC